MFTSEELKDPSTNINERLSNISDTDLIQVVRASDKNGLSLLHFFAKYRNAEEFSALLDRLPIALIEEILSRFVSVKVKRNSVQVVKQATLLHFVLKYQSAQGFIELYRRVNTAKIKDIIEAHDCDSGRKLVSWETMICTNDRLGKPTKSGAISEADALVSSIKAFVAIIEKCKEVCEKKVDVIEINLSKLAFELALFYRDDSEKFKNWGLFHFVCYASHMKHVKTEMIREQISKIMRNLSHQRVQVLSQHRCQDTKHKGCNVLHFLLLYVKNVDDVVMFCKKSSDENLNALLCKRMGGTSRLLNLYIRNWSALQMTLSHLPQPCLEYILARTSPEALFFALKIDDVPSQSSDNTKSAYEIAKSNANLTWDIHGFDKILQKIRGVRLFYELYNYFKYIEKTPAFDLSERKLVVFEFLTILKDSDQEPYKQKEQLEEFYYDKCEFDAFSCIPHVPIRAFHEIMYDICCTNFSGLTAVKEGYLACKDLLFDYVNGAELDREVHDDVGSEPEKKKVRLASRDEIFEFKKGN